MKHDDFEFGIPEELRPWYEANRDRLREHCRLKFYILDGGRLKQVSMPEHALWMMQDSNTCIDYTDLAEDYYVSTVFLGLATGQLRLFPDEIQVPFCFETMVFGGPHDQFQRRYHTLGDAKRGHWQIVESLRAGDDPRTLEETEAMEAAFRLLRELLGEDFDAETENT